MVLSNPCSPHHIADPSQRAYHLDFRKPTIVDNPPAGEMGSQEHATRLFEAQDEPADNIDGRGPQASDLCETCSSLHLSLDKFLPPEPASDGLPGVLSREYDPAGLKTAHLGYLDEIYLRRERCAFCWLVFHATHTKNRAGIGYDGLRPDGSRVPCELDWQLDGRILGDQTKPPTRRIRIFEPQQHFPDAYIVALAQSDDEDGPVPMESATPSFLGRRIDLKQVNTELLGRWLSICRGSHGLACDRRTLTGLPPAPLEGVRLVDLVDERLVHFESLETTSIQYATASYMWGMTPFIRLTSDYLTELSQHLGPYTSGVPPVLRDAMLLTKELGIRYIWIDALCIIQDDRDDWSHTAPLMDRIYGNGTINFCAAAGHDTSRGLPGCPTTVRSTSQPIAKCGNLELTVVKPVESLIEGTNWNTRAWTFQERMLSPRSIIFVDDRVFFQCRSATWSEDVHTESDKQMWTLEMVGSPLQNYARNPVRLFIESVELYSGRLLTVSSDRLIAFEGMAAVLCPPLKASLVFGLPDSYFDLAMLWENKVSTDRINIQEARGHIFPSWSWCGWKGAALWRLSMVTGVLINLHDWLENHTWIVWYVLKRDTEATGPAPPRLIWGSSQWSGLPNKVTRWDGYCSELADRPGRKAIQRFVIPEDSSSQSSLETELPTMPTLEEVMPGSLCFWTYTAHFQLSRENKSNAAFTSKLEPGLHRFSTLDVKGDWCGTIVLPESWFDRVGGVFKFAAISEARDFSMEELDTWNYYIPEERELSEWYLFYAILIAPNKDTGVDERVGLAKIYRDAFKSSSFEPGLLWSEIVLP